MKYTAYLLFLCLMFSSCHSYKNVDMTNYEFIVSKKYKVKIQESDKIKGKIYKIDKDSIFLMVKGDKISIPISKIENLKHRKFSYLKTTAALVSSLLISYVVYLACCWELNFGDGKN